MPPILSIRWLPIFSFVNPTKLTYSYRECLFCSPFFIRILHVRHKYLPQAGALSFWLVWFCSDNYDWNKKPLGAAKNTCIFIGWTNSYFFGIRRLCYSFDVSEFSVTQEGILPASASILRRVGMLLNCLMHRLYSCSVTNDVLG